MASISFGAEKQMMNKKHKRQYGGQFYEKLSNQMMGIVVDVNSGKYTINTDRQPTVDEEKKLINALCFNKVKKLDSLLNKGISPDTTLASDLQDKYLLLTLAARYGSLECLDLLLRKGADPNKVVGHRNPLDVGVFCNQYRAVKRLVASGAVIDFPRHIKRCLGAFRSEIGVWLLVRNINLYRSILHQKSM